MRKHARDTSTETDTHDAPAVVRSLTDIHADLSSAQARLAELKAASPRDAEAIHAQKLAIQDVTEAIRQREAAGE